MSDPILVVIPSRVDLPFSFHDNYRVQGLSSTSWTIKDHLWTVSVIEAATVIRARTTEKDTDLARVRLLLEPEREKNNQVHDITTFRRRKVHFCRMYTTLSRAQH